MNDKSHATAPQPDYSWQDKAYFGRTCQACGHEIKCQPPKDYDKGASYITLAYAYKACPKCRSEAFDYGSYRHAESCDCFYCAEDIADTPANATPHESNTGADDGNAGVMSPKYEWNEDGWDEPHGIAAQAISSRHETVGDRLKRFYPEHYTRIITEMNRQNGAEHAAHFLSKTTVWIPNPNVGFLCGAFLWANSQEGYDFWAKLAEREER